MRLHSTPNRVNISFSQATVFSTLIETLPILTHSIQLRQLKSMMHTFLILLQLRYAVARRFHQGLPHEVINVTQTIEAFVAAPITVNHTTTQSSLASTSTHSVYSVVYPSPNASPVEITAQSQVVTSYIPEMTWCVGPPMELVPITGPPYLNGTPGYSTIIAGTGSCETMYSPLETVCDMEHLHTIFRD